MGCRTQATSLRDGGKVGKAESLKHGKCRLAQTKTFRNMQGWLSWSPLIGKESFGCMERSRKFCEMERRGSCRSIP